MIIGTFAYCGSGQDTLADGFCTCKNYTKYSLGDVFRSIAKKRGLMQSREVLQSLRREYDHRFGRSYVPRHIVAQINQDHRNNKDIIITGIRTVDEYTIFRKELGMRLLFVYADKSVRYSRMIRRASEKDSTDVATLDYNMSLEEKMFDYKELEQFADYQFDFSMKLEEFQTNKEELIERIIGILKDSRKSYGIREFKSY